jgi:carbon-monoxide dehydrogenase large subunit
VHICTPSQAEGGFRGIGEGGAIIGPPTLVNAIADALSPFGARCLDLPLTPSRILDLIEGRPITRRPSGRATPMTVTSEPAQEESSIEALPSAPPAVQATVVDGLWKITLSTPMGPQTFTARFVTDGTRLTGTLDSDIGSENFEGTVDGGQLNWTMKVTKPMPITLKYDILVDGDRLTGKAKMGMFGTAKLKGERL